MPTVLFVGATGCIGGSVLAALQKAHPTFRFKALVRNTASIEQLNAAVSESDAAKVLAVKGSFEDQELVERLTYEADFVVNAADSDNLTLRDGILEGFKKRSDEGKPLGGYIHTSGTAIFMDGHTDGKLNANGKVWTDDEEDIRSLTENQIHGPVDVSLLKAQEKGYFNGYIICPSGVHGIGGGPLKKPSLMFKYLVKDAVQHKRAAYVGEGSNISGLVHIDDLVPVYLAAFTRLVEATGRRLDSSPYARYIIVAREFVELKQIFAWMVPTLRDLKVIDNEELQSLTPEEAGPALNMLSQNTLCRVGQANSFGFRPVHPTAQETVSEDLRLTLEVGV